MEWSTRSENCLHAYKTGLRTDNTPILVKDLRDGSVVRYYSLWECARNFEVEGSSIHNELKPYNYGKVYKNYYILIREGNEWPKVGADAIGLHRNGVAKVVVARNVETEEIKIFNSVGIASKYFNLLGGTLLVHIKRNGPRPYHGWSFRYMGFMDILDIKNNQLEGQSYSPEMVS